MDHRAVVRFSDRRFFPSIHINQIKEKWSPNKMKDPLEKALAMSLVIYAGSVLFLVTEIVRIMREQRGE